MKKKNLQETIRSNKVKESYIIQEKENKKRKENLQIW